DLVAHALPVQVGAVMRCQTDNHDEDEQQNSAAAKTACAITLLQGDEVLDQRDDTPENDQNRPETPEEMPHWYPQSQVVQQEQHPNENQDQRSGQRTAVTICRRWWLQRRRGRRCVRASHCAPPPDLSHSHWERVWLQAGSLPEAATLAVVVPESVATAGGMAGIPAEGGRASGGCVALSRTGRRPARAAGAALHSSSR